jgi:4-amino-4-deoxy-L-arabinose transferase-like glycosyltransferase
LILISSSKIKTTFAVLLLSVIAFYAYQDILDYFFTGLDSLNLIDESRINNFNDFFNIFVSPMSEEFAWYRPIAVLSYSIDFSIWRLEPFGYFLTNIIIHISATILVFVLAIKLFKGNYLIAFTSALIFTLHPVLIEDIPAPARRVDPLTAVFFLFSMITFMHSYEARRKRMWLWSSWIFYLLALGTKEIAIILPPLIFFYTVLFRPYDHDKDVLCKIRTALKTAVPFLLITFVYLGVRTFVLKSLGGYAPNYGIFGAFQLVLSGAVLYFADLLYPVDFLYLNSIFSPSVGLIRQLIFFIISSAYIAILIKYRHSLVKNLEIKHRVLVRFLVFVVLASAFAIIVYPVVSPFIEHMILSTYSGNGADWLSSIMDNRGVYPVDFYLFKARDIILFSAIMSFILSVTLVISIRSFQKIRYYFTRDDRGKIFLLLLLWLLLPLIIYLITVTFDHHDMYIPVIPFSIILAALLISKGEIVLCRTGCTESAPVHAQSLKRKPLWHFGIVASIVLSLIIFSPLFFKYGEWAASGKVQKMFIEKLSSKLNSFPDNSTLQISDFPGGIESYRNKMPRAREVSYYAAFSIKAWLDMTYPNNSINVIIQNKVELPEIPLDIELRIDKNTDGSIRIVPEYIYAMETEDN